MKVSELSEFKLIQLLADVVSKDQFTQLSRLNSKGYRLRLSIGDDAAAWDVDTSTQVFTTDALVEGIHFETSKIGWNDLGWKCMAVNLSDLAAMGCFPTFSTITLGLPGIIPVEGLIEMYEGIHESISRYGGVIVGGDVVNSPVFFISVAMQGTPSKKANRILGPILPRNAASPGDLIAVTGHLGCSAGGLHMLQNGLGFDDSTMDHLLQAHQRPFPRIDAGASFATNGATSAIDISDGLLNDLFKLIQSSRVDALVKIDTLPVDEFLQKSYPTQWLDFAVNGGEDYELIVTARQETIEKVIDEVNLPVTIIGEILEGSGSLRIVDRYGENMQFDQKGWDHFPDSI